MKKIAYLTNVTADIIAQKLSQEYDIYLPAGYDTWMTEVRNKTSALYQGGIEAVFLILDGTMFRALSPEDPSIDAQVQLWRSAAAALAERAGAVPVFMATVDFRESRIRTFRESGRSLDRAAAWERFVTELSSRFGNVYLLDLRDRIMDLGRNQFYSDKLWYLGSMPYSKVGVQTILEEIHLAMQAAFSGRAKVLVSDLDNTLWGGVAGEDGVSGIGLSAHGEGSQYRDFQLQLAEMKKRGVLLAINSRNNESDAATVFKEHPDMALSESDFACSRINWQNKSVNLLEMEEELNLGEAAFVVVDDNPMERAEIAENCPDARMPAFPKDSAQLVSFAEKLYQEQFRLLQLTGEDRDKTEMYRQESGRRRLQAQSSDPDNYLRSLEITIDMHCMLKSERERVQQLCSKTNQFNLTTIRYSLQEITSMPADIYTVTTADQFGSNGLIAVLICRSDPEMDAVVIDSFLMSCRVMGRKIEYAVLALAARQYDKDLIGIYRRTQKNAPVEGLYSAAGFDLIEDAGNEKRYLLPRDRRPSLPDCFARVVFEGIEIL